MTILEKELMTDREKLYAAESMFARAHGIINGVVASCLSPKEAIITLEHLNKVISEEGYRHLHEKWIEQNEEQILKLKQ